MTDAEKELQRETGELREFAETMADALSGMPDWHHMRDCAIECCREFDRAKERVERERKEVVL